MRLKQLYLAGTILLFAVLVLWLGADPGRGQVPLPKDFFYQQTKPLSPVPFSHELHVTQKKAGCQECHTKLFQMKKGTASPQMTMEKLNAGQFCGACHDGTKAVGTKDPQGCTKCHRAS